MTSHVHTPILAINAKNDSSEENLDIEKLQQEVSEGFTAITADLAPVELKSEQEISKMTNEEFFNELELLDRQYQDKVEFLIEQEIKKEQQRQIEYEKKQKIAKENEEKEKELKALREKVQADIIKSKKSKLESNIESYKLVLKGTDPSSTAYESALVNLEQAQNALAALEEKVI
jgi:hypothetical protein